MIYINLLAIIFHWFSCLFFVNWLYINDLTAGLSRDYNLMFSNSFSCAMERNEVIETIGSITKYEHLCSLETDVLKNTLVLKSMNPFPGFKDKRSTGTKSGSIFIILKYRYAPEKINRINKSLRENAPFKCSPSFGEIIVNQVILPCIRIKRLKDESHVANIQDFLIKHDLILMPYSKFDENARIKIFKSFRLIEIAEGIYRDLNDKEKFYFRIPQAINWKKFDYISNRIKHRIENNNFDAALGVVYRFCGPEDVIRIYDTDLSLQRALELRKSYTVEIKKDIQISANHT